MDIQYRKTGTGITLFVEVESGKGEMVCSLRDATTLVIEHTAVDEALRGQHIGEALVEAGLAYAREQGLEVVPVCPFARKVMERRPS